MTRFGARLAWGAGLLGFAAAVVFLAMPRTPKPDTDEEEQPPIQRKSRLARTPEGDIVLTLDAATQARAGLKTAALDGVTLQPQITAYGRLQDDPAETFEVRAPAAGMLRAAGRPWPLVGEVVADGLTVGTIQPRLTLMDSLSISDRLVTARSDVKTARSSADAARAAWERARVLNADNRNVSDRALQEAESRLKSDEAKLAAALDAVKLLETALDSSSSPGSERALVAARGGEVAEVLAAPGESVESGQPLLRLKRYERLIALINLQPGQQAASGARTARIIPSGVDGESLQGKLIGRGARVDPDSQLQPLLFGVTVPRRDLRPGMAVTAQLPASGRSLKGVIIPEAAVVHYAGRAWAYLKSGDDKFVRKEVRLDFPVEHGWFVTSGIDPGARVVVEGAQLLLSEELKSQIQVGEENPA